MVKNSFLTMFALFGAARHLVSASKLGDFEISRVGVDGTSKPAVEIKNSATLTGRVFFQAVQHWFDQPEGSGIWVNLYSRSEDHVCVESSLLSSNVAGERPGDVGTTIATLYKLYPDYNEKYGPDDPDFVKAENGVIAFAKFRVDDYEALTGENSIYTAFDQVTDGWKGSVGVCVRVGIKVDVFGDGNPWFVSILDSALTIKVPAPNEHIYGCFNCPDATVDDDQIPGSESFSFSVEGGPDSGVYNKVTKTFYLEIFTYLCDENNNRITSVPTFEMGMDFRVCIEPGTDIRENPVQYYVKSFIDVTCSNAGETRDLFKLGVPEVLTRPSSTDENGKLSFTSVVTPGFFNDPDMSFTCTGSVSLEEYPDGRTRKLRETAPVRFILANDQNNEKNDRKLVDTSEFDFMKPPFDLKIGVAGDPPKAAGIELPQQGFLWVLFQSAVIASLLAMV